MAPIPKFVSGFVKALKNRAQKKDPEDKKKILPSTPSASTATAVKAKAVNDFIKGAPFPITVHMDQFNTVLRVKIPEINYQITCEQLIQRGDLIREIKKIFLFHSLESPVHLHDDHRHQAFWDILIYTKDPEKQKAILDMLASKTDLFALKTRSVDQILPLPTLHTEKSSTTAKQPPVTPAEKKETVPPLDKKKNK